LKFLYFLYEPLSPVDCAKLLHHLYTLANYPLPFM
jgi:hypothetical protein